MSTSYITISLDSEDKSTDSFISYIILLYVEAKETASPASFAPPSLDYVRTSQDYVLALNIEIESFEELTSPDYASGSDIETEPFDEDPQEAECGPEESL
ncbi:hypothetical protein Tco_1422291 [Tanacetum coccineum]